MSRSILKCVDWEAVNVTVKQEQKVRHLYTPVISLYRWWARRPHSLIGALLDATYSVFDSEQILVSDPFSGGGTVAFEATTRNLSVYAQDLYPWPTFCLETGLSTPSTHEMKAASEQLLNSLVPLRDHFRRPDGKELSHVLRVRVGSCPTCSNKVYLFPKPMFSACSRRKSESEAFFGCSGCGSVTRLKRDQSEFACRVCGCTNSELKQDGFIYCPHCSATAPQSQYCEGSNTWHPILVQEPIKKDGRLRAMLRCVDELDPVSFQFATDEVPGLSAEIQDGIETRRLLNAGFHYWGDLYTARQAKVICDALKNVTEMDVSDACRDRLALAIIGAGEMPAFLSRWDRFHAKAYEGIANHRYAHTTLAAETNFLAPLGRGTLLVRLKSAMKALDWAHENIPNGAVSVHLVDRHKKSNSRRAKVRIATGDSRVQGLGSNSVDLVLTDPPYFDDVQYGELARLFHFWLGQYRDLGKIEELREAVPNTNRGNGADYYERAIAECLKESRRTLKRDGRIVLTFHNRSIKAWAALAKALILSGLVVSAIAVARAENAADLTKRNGRGLLHDLVLECVKSGGVRSGMAEVVFSGPSDEERSILAIGRALDYVVRRSKPEQLQCRYEHFLAKLSVEKGSIKCGGKHSNAIPKDQTKSAMAS